MIDFIKPIDKNECCKMMDEFYSSDVVDHSIPKKNIENTISLALTDNPYNKVIICKYEKEYAGYCHISQMYSCEVGGIVLFIEEIYIRDKFKGKGLGTDIITFIRKEFDSKVKRYRLEIVSSNMSAIRLYERLGFEFLAYKQMILDIPHS